MTKSGLMVGLGETHEELVDTFAALREHGVGVLTVGQYLRPSERHLPVVRYWHPDEFAALERAAYELGFDHVAAGPLVRSSYHADQHVPAGPRQAAGRSPASIRRVADSLRRSSRRATSDRGGYDAYPRAPRGARLILGFAFLTVGAALDQGITIGSALSALVARAVLVSGSSARCSILPAGNTPLIGTSHRQRASLDVTLSWASRRSRGGRASQESHEHSHRS